MGRAADGLMSAAAGTLVRLGMRRIVATMAVSAAGLTGITMEEGMVQRVYLDPIAIPTVCVGHTATVTRADVGKVFSEERCAELLRSDAQTAERGVKRCVTFPVTQNQYDALVSFTFNVGVANLCASTLVRKHNAGDCRGAAAEFPRWNKAAGRPLPGLTKRRAHERAAYEADCE